MGYDATVLRRARERLDRERRDREDRSAALKTKLFAQIPELSDIDRQLRGTMLDVIAASLRSGSDPTPAVQVLRDKNMALQDRQAQLLREAGYPEDALDNAPMCKKCGDTGWQGGKMCECLQALCAQEQVKELSKVLDLGEQSFDSFSLEWYSPLPWPGEAASPRENMEFLCELCMNYAQKFGKFYFQNLFLTGDPGLGKTFLSACIAKVVAENGFSVVYDTAVNVFAQFEEQKFGKAVQDGREAQEETRRYLGCDLLILDDLGSEMTTAFTQSALYTLVNSRLVSGKSTVISSNLSIDGVRERYNGQTASRLAGEYRILRFYGEDIRLQRKARL
ncbi:MAG: ATP-binding protein [Oscillospiraceae bacterium]|nr:ATP-binding protein [Oscillospiraceae bacterium]MBP3520873.1 ATP-binding protein [Oscillospiraceae bacterium]